MMGPTRTNGVALGERPVFGIQDRDELRDRVIEMARDDPRVVAAAEVGSLAAEEGDRWSDLDLTFAVDESVSVETVLNDWTSTLEEKLGAVELFDLAVGPTIYRVFMFEDCLQLDVSFTPASEFRPTSPRFRPVFGEHREEVLAEPQSARSFLGWALMWSRHARVCVERGRLRQAEHAIFRMRECALDFAAGRRGLPAGYGRGLELLPADVYARFASSLVPDVNPITLRNALKSCVAALMTECEEDTDTDPITCRRLSETIEDF